jgi:hypothetical protein
MGVYRPVIEAAAVTGKARRQSSMRRASEISMMGMPSRIG